MATLSLIDQVNEAVPGSVVAVEGANEINNYPLTFNGVSGLQGAINMQSALYAAVKSDPNLPGVAVDYFTGYGAGGIAQGPDPATTPGLADDDTQHPYPNNGSATASYVAPSVALSNEPSGAGPAVYTETGYSTNGGTNGAVNADVLAKYTLDLLFDDAKSGISRTYLYQLMDAYAPGSPQGDDGYGLFGISNAPKEAATAIHNLTSILTDMGATAATFIPVAINDTVSGLPSSGNSLLLEKSSGAYDIVVWNKPQIWNEATGTEITAPAATIAVELGATYRNVEVFDPLVSASPIAAYSNVSTVKLAVTDHPLIVDVEPGLAAAVPALTIVGTAGETITTTAGIVDRTGNLPPLPGVFPDYGAPIVRNGPDGRDLVMARWGMPTPPQFLKTAKSEPQKTDPGITNIRNVKSSHWRRWLGVESRSLVPFTSFSEHEMLPDGSRRPFAPQGSRKTFFQCRPRADPTDVPHSRRIGAGKAGLPAAASAQTQRATTS